MAPVAWLLPLTGVGLPMFWRALAVLCLVVLVWMLVRSRRARTGRGRRRPSVDGAFENSLAFRRAWPGWAVVTAGVAVTVGILLVHQSMLLETRAFEARATEELAEVVSYDDDNFEMKVRIGAAEFTLDEPLWDERYEVGAFLSVLVDSDEPGHIVFLAELEDLSWLPGFALTVPILGLGWGLPVILRSRRRRALMDLGSGAATVVLSQSMDNDYWIEPVDAASPRLKVVNLQGVVPLDGDDAEDVE